MCNNLQLHANWVSAWSNCKVWSIVNHWYYLWHIIIWEAGLAPAEDFDFQSFSDIYLFHCVGSAMKHIEQMFWSEKGTRQQNTHTNTSKYCSAGILLFELEGMETSTEGGKPQQQMHHINKGGAAGGTDKYICSGSSCMKGT